MKLRILVAALAVLSAGAALAIPVTYNLDPTHTYPSFIADHLGGLSKWRGKFTKNSGTVVLDRVAKTGTIEIKIDPASIDFGNGKLNEHAKGPDMFDAVKYPEITYKGKFTKFEGDVPKEVEGELTMHGITKPVNLKIDDFNCKIHPMLKREACGAEVEGMFNRAEFGIDYGKAMGFKQEVRLQIQVEGIRLD